MRSIEEDTVKYRFDRGSRPTLTALWEGGGFTVPLPESGRVVLGRGASADVVVDHGSISRKHVALHIGPELFVEDLGSSNGTKVRGDHISPNEQVAVRWGSPSRSAPSW